MLIMNTLLTFFCKISENSSIILSPLLLESLRVLVRARAHTRTQFLLFWETFESK